MGHQGTWDDVQRNKRSANAFPRSSSYGNTHETDTGTNKNKQKHNENSYPGNVKHEINPDRNAGFVNNSGSRMVRFWQLPVPSKSSNEETKKHFSKCDSAVWLFLEKGAQWQFVIVILTAEIKDKHAIPIKQCDVRAKICVFGRLPGHYFSIVSQQCDIVIIFLRLDSLNFCHYFIHVFSRAAGVFEVIPEQNIGVLELENCEDVSRAVVSVAFVAFLVAGCLPLFDTCVVCAKSPS